MILFGTSFIVALLNGEGIFHSQAKKVFEKIPDEEDLAVHYLVIQETYAVMCRKAVEQGHSIEEIFSILEGFFDEIGIMSSLPDEGEILAVMKRSKCGLSYVDAVLAHLNKRAGFKVLTFDRKLIGHLSPL